MVPAREPAAAPRDVAALARRGQTTVGNRATGRWLSRRLFVSGDFDRFERFVEIRTGLDLFQDVLPTGQVFAAGPPDPLGCRAHCSPALAQDILRVINDPSQDAELDIGANQDRVLVGAFPNPRDLTGGRVQRLDMSDIESFERDIPGMGLAAIAHELHENWEAHGVDVVPGKDRFQESHDEAIEQENEVVAEIGLGERVCDRTSPRPNATRPGQQIRVQDYTNEYVIMETERTTSPSGHTDVQLVASRRAGRRLVERFVIDGYASGSAVAPGRGYGAMWKAQKLLRAHPLSMAWVEGHADSSGTATGNDKLSFQRAKGVRDVLIAGTGLEARNFNTKGRGTSDPVADDATAQGRAQNRRVVITIEEPDITL